GLPPAVGRASSRGLRPECSPALRAAHFPMPPDPVGRRERSRARPPPRCWGGRLRAGSAQDALPLCERRTSRCPQTPSAGVNALGLPPLLGRAFSRGLHPACSPPLRAAHVP